MLKNYFTTAINNLIKNKLYSAINIVGLAIGLAACILLTLYVRDELSYDKKWVNSNLIYRVNNEIQLGPGPVNIFPVTSSLALPALKQFFPGDIAFGTRVQGRSGEIQIGDNFYPGEISFVDEDFIDIFQCEVLKGNLINTLQSPGNLALSEASAALYFGEKDPIGETITLILQDGQEKQYKITAVYRFASPNTVLDVPGFSLFVEPESDPPNWFAFRLATYIRFSETADISQFVDRLPDFVNRNILPGGAIQLDPDTQMSDVRRFTIQQMSDIYFNPMSIMADQPARTGNKTVITVFIVISVLILIIASINYVILTTAKATRRAREIAMRKVVGARFRQLLFQFLGESVFIAGISLLLAVAITESALPLFDLIVDKKLAVPYSSPGSYLFAILLLIFVGLVGGLYPSFVLSRFAPGRALKANKTTEADGSIRMRNILVIFQFSASIVLIIATAAAFFQLLYAAKHDPGFNPENLLVIEGIGRPDIAPYRETLQKELLKLPEVTHVALSSLQPKLVGAVVQSLSALRRKTDDATLQQDKFFNNLLVDYNFFETYGISLLSGRLYTRGMDREEPEQSSETESGNNGERRIVINLEAARQFGFTSALNAVGKILVSGNPGGPRYAEYTIIGVVADSQYRSLRTKPEPELYYLGPEATFFLTVRYRGDYLTAAKEIKRVWHEVVGDVLFQDHNVIQNLESTFSQEETENMVLIAFALLSVFIACLGLYGMASFTVDRRVKEIGIRKVMGAKVKDIIKLFLWQFLKPVLIANIIAWPLAIYAMQSWLERFPYRFNSLYIGPICLASALIALAVAWFTVAGNTFRAARNKPIHSLRYE